MKIVIDIDDDMYKAVINNDAYVLGDVDWILLENAIANSIPLPKNHGRLIDADELKPRDISPEAWYSPMWGFELVDIEDAPTIIEAESEEEK